jgi:streptomycin 6-kinase
MTAFAMPRYLADTARRDRDVRGWLAELPGLVADLAGRWSLEVGEPFQPGGRCSWTAPVTGPAGADLVLKVGFRFPGGEERDGAAGLRLWDGHGAARLYAACETESAQALLIERCLPGTPLGRALPEPEQDQVVAGPLRQLWAQPHASYPFRPLTQMCAAWADEFERDYAAAGAADRIDPGLARAGIALFRVLPETAVDRVLLCTDLHGDNILAAQRAPWLVIDPSPTSAILPTTSCSTCSTARTGWPPTRPDWRTGWRAWPELTPAECGSGCSPEACRSRSARRSCAGWPGGSRSHLRRVHEPLLVPQHAGGRR